MNPDIHIQPNKKVVPKTSFHPETLNIETIEPPVIELTSRKPDGNKFNRKNVPKMDTSLTVRKPASARRKTGYKKTISKRKLQAKKSFIAEIPKYVSLWPRSEVIAGYFQFVALLTSVLAIEHTKFKFQFALSNGLTKISLAGDKLTRIMLIFQAVILGLGVFFRVTWPSRREEMTAAAMRKELKYCFHNLSLFCSEEGLSFLRLSIQLLVVQIIHS